MVAVIVINSHTGLRSHWGGRSDRPLRAAVAVAGLADPRFLVEISAVAVR